MTPKIAFKRLVDSIEVYDQRIDLTKDELWSLGLQPWAKESGENGGEDPNGRELWLFPHSFYEHIPTGFPIVFIDFQCGEFVPGVTDDDSRFGYLAFGVLGFIKQP